ncbi:hypothetical protein DXC97_03920 [Lachnospiraceae bacterium TF09-5]|nr:hypothetical protein DXC97_03920 [Lachnospiraceae bacterium TF09-5]
MLYLITDSFNCHADKPSTVLIQSQNTIRKPVSLIILRGCWETGCLKQEHYRRKQQALLNRNKEIFALK